MKKLWKYVMLLLIMGSISRGQNVGIGTATPNASAILELSSANQGFLMTRIGLTGTNDATTIPTPATGLLVYNTAIAGAGATAVTPGFYYWDGTRWQRLLNTQSDDWTIFGNAGTNPTTNFIGTTDARDFVVRTNNVEIMRVTAAGNVGVGTNVPATNVRLHVEGDATFTIGIAGLALNTGVYGSATIANGSGVYGYGANIDAYGVTGVGGTGRTGVLGYIDGGAIWYSANSGGSFTGANTGVYGRATAAGGDGVWGISATTTGFGGIFQGGGARAGVAGYITTPFNFIAGSGGSFTGNGVGAYGKATSATGNGIIGLGNNLTTYNSPTVGSGGAFTGSAVGAYGKASSTSGTGTIGVGNNLASYSTLTAGSGVAGTGTGFGVYGRASGAAGNRAGGYFSSNGGAFAYVGANVLGTVYKIYGSGTVSTTVKYNNKHRTLFAPESPEVLFMDYGLATLSNGKALVQLDPIFASAVKIDNKHPLRVFVQMMELKGCGTVAVTKRTATHFVVEAEKPCNAEFTYMIVANRADEYDENGKLISKYQDLRFPVGPGPLEESEATTYQGKDLKQVKTTDIAIKGDR